MNPWFERLKSFLPGWIFSTGGRVVTAVYKAIGSMLGLQELNLREHIGETRIGTAEGQFLDLIGEGRGIARRPGEPDDVYRVRLRQIVGSSDCAAILANVNSVLRVRPARLVEDADTNTFLNRGVFLNRNAIALRERIKNAFSLILPSQEVGGETFLNRGFFANRGAFAGSRDVSLQFYQNIVRIVEETKATGVVWRLIVRVGR